MPLAVRRSMVLPEGYSHADVEAEGGWKTALYRRAAPIPSQFRTRTTMVGKVYTTDKGMTLYSFSCTEIRSARAWNPPRR